MALIRHIRFILLGRVETSALEVILRGGRNLRANFLALRSGKVAG
jgi:hypothetical protein